MLRSSIIAAVITAFIWVLRTHICYYITLLRNVITALQWVLRTHYCSAFNTNNCSCAAIILLQYWALRAHTAKLYIRLHQVMCS